MLSNSEMKEQVYSLKLSNNDTCGQIQAFLSFFSFDEFISLRSLTLIGIVSNDVNKLKSFLPKSCSIHLIDPDDEVKGELSLERTFRIQTLSKTYQCHLPLLFKIPAITHLTFSHCSCCDLSKLFQYAPMLKYVNVEMNSWERFPMTNYYRRFSNHCAIHLKQLIMLHFHESFLTLEMLFEQTPHLESLTIESSMNREIMDAPRWERIITSLLPQLTIFECEFESNCLNSGDDSSDDDNLQHIEDAIFDKFKEFQTDFWQEQHHWFFKYFYYPIVAIIKTIPYNPNIIAEDNNVVNKTKQFNDAKELTIYLLDVTENCKYYWKNVTTLRLAKSSSWKKEDDNLLQGREFLQSLKTMVNLYNLKELEIYWILSVGISFLLSEIFKEAPNLSSLKIEPDDLLLLFGNDELCKYLNKVIKKLYVYPYPLLFTNDYFTEKFCQIFSNIEQLICTIRKPCYVLLLLKRLSKLSAMKISFHRKDHSINLSSFKREARKLDILFRIESIKRGGDMDDSYDDISITYTKVLMIWIGNSYK